MKTVSALIACALILVLIASPAVRAHSPTMAGNNESLDTAMVIDDPTKSWAVYAELHEGGEAQYFRFSMAEGKNIYVQLFKSTAQKNRDFLPSLVLMGPGLADSGATPDYLERPNGSGAIVVAGVQPSQATYEPFAPSSFYELATLSIPAPVESVYHVAVFEPNNGGNYGLAIGERESFTLAEWVLTPFTLLSVHEWEGQNLALILAPAIVTVIVGLILLLWRWRPFKAMRMFDWLGILAGLIFLGSGAIVLVQMMLAVSHSSIQGSIGVTLMFALLPAVLGLATIRMVILAESRSIFKTRLFIVIFGVLAIFLWAGYIIGSVLALLAAVMPFKQGTMHSIDAEAKA